MKTTPMTPIRRAARGFSLIELMTAITIGLLILVGLTSVFVNSSNANREMKNTAEQIESGRYAIEFLTQDIRHAGYYGELTTLPAVPGSAPDPCAAPTAGTVSDTVNPGLALPLQQISPSSIPTGCSALLTAANLAANSDIVVVRRAETTMLPVTSAATVTVTANDVYLQTSADTAEIQYSAAGTIDGTKKADGAATVLQRRDFSVAATGTPPQFPIIAAAIRKYRTHIYFVAPCSAGSAASGACTGAAGEDMIPTLKRLEFKQGGSGAFSISPIVEGIQAIRIEYGVDSSPATADPGTGLIGDGLPESYTNAPSVADMGNTVAARIYVLARNTSPTRGYVDDKTYTMGSYTTTATNDAYKRHVYGGETRIANQAGRREIPR